MTRLNRRQVLRGMLGGAAVTVGLPWLEALSGTTRRARAGGLFPQRFGLVMWGNGNVPEKWVPTITGPDWELTEELAPLGDLRHKLSVVSGLEVRVPNTIPHFSGPSGLLTGKVAIGEEGNWTFAGPTLDQILAEEIGNDTRFRSLEAGVDPGSGLSFNGPHSRNPPESDPFRFFERVFGGGFSGPGEEWEVDPTLALRRSVLDVVSEQARSLQQRLGSEDKARLDQHLTGIRELELRLTRLESEPPDLEACVPPEAPLEGETPADLLEHHEIMAELMVMALACDATRVFNYNLSHAVSNFLHPGRSAGHHYLTHNEPGIQPEVHAITVRLMEGLASFLDRLDRVDEGDGTLLDHCGILCTSEMSLGKTHSIQEYPIVLAGSACGALRTGSHIRYESRANASMVPLTLMRAFGLLAPEFGEGDTRTRDSIEELLA